MDVWLIRGVQGSGKTELAEKLTGLYQSPVILAADDFFTRPDGSYHFVASLVGEAHKSCETSFDHYLRRPDVDCVMVTNVFARHIHLNPYIRMIKKHRETGGQSITLRVLIVQDHHGTVNTHEVPREVINRVKLDFEL